MILAGEQSRADLGGADGGLTVDDLLSGRRLPRRAIDEEKSSGRESSFHRGTGVDSFPILLQRRLQRGDQGRQ